MQLGILLTLALSLPLPTTAEEASTEVTVQNLTPEIVALEVLLDARLGAFLYEVRATDGNGAPDLDRVIFHFLDRHGGLWTHTDRDGKRDGNTVVWSGLAHAGRGLTEGPFRVHLHVYDRLDAEAQEEAPVTLLTPLLEEVHDPGPPTAERPTGRTVRDLMPLLHEATVSPAPLTGLILLTATGLVVVVAVAWRTTARPPPQRRSGGGPRGR